MLYRIYLKFLTIKWEIAWWIVSNFMPKTHNRWEKEAEEQSSADFRADYNNEMFWQQQNGR